MAQRNYSIPPEGVGLPSTDGLPQSFVSNLQQAQQAAAQQYNSGSFRARHPLGGVAMDAMLGVVTGNPLAAVMMPVMGRRREQNRKASISQAYQDYLTGQVDMMGKIKDLNTSNNKTKFVNTALTNSGIASPFGAEDYIDSDTQNAALNGGTAESSYNRIRQDQTADYQNIMGPALGQIPKAPPQPGQLGEGQLDTSGVQINTGIAKEGEAPALRPFTYMNPDLVKQAITNQTDLQQTALQQAPDFAKVNPEIQKLQAEVTKLVAEGKVEEARKLLIEAQTKTEQARPGLVQAQTGYYNRMPSPSSSQPNHDAVMMQLYGQEGLKNAGYGLPQANFSSGDALATFQLQSVINDTSGQYTPVQKQAAAAALGRLSGGFGTPSAGVAAAPATRPGQTERSQAVLDKLTRGNQKEW